MLRVNQNEVFVSPRDERLGGAFEYTIGRAQ